MPIVIRMEGTNVEQGKQMLTDSGLNFTTADTMMREAAERGRRARRGSSWQRTVSIDKNTRLIVQGITGREGTFHAKQAAAYGTKVVGGVTPGKGGTTHEGWPVFNTVADAVRETGANATVIFVPPPFAADAILEAADAGLPLAVCITEGIPTLDMMRALTVVRGVEDAAHRAQLSGPHHRRPGEGRHHPGPHLQGRAGRDRVEERHAHLRSDPPAHQARPWSNDVHRHRRRSADRHELHRRPVALRRRSRDRSVVMIGEIGGNAEQEAAAYIARNFKKPVVGFIAGQTAPPGRRMGHAGAIIAGGKGTAAEKMAALAAAGVHVVKSPADIGAAVKRALARMSRVRQSDGLSGRFAII